MTTGRTDPRAGHLPEPEDLLDIDGCSLPTTTCGPDPLDPAQRVAFGTSGHRGSSLSATFTDAHVTAISEAVRRYRLAAGIDGPLFLGRDTHALSVPAFQTIVEVVAAHAVHVVLDDRDGATPAPVMSHARLTHNRGEGRWRGGRDRRDDVPQPA